MASSAAPTSSEYISHHLTNWHVGHGFWTLHLDTILVSWFVGIVAFGFFALAASRASAGVPGRFQSFVEMLVDFVDAQVKDSYHGKRGFVTPLALTIFLWVWVMNAMDFLPVDLMAYFYKHAFGLENWRQVPTSDVNTTFALALTVWLLMIFFSVKAKGIGGFFREMFCTPFGSHPVLWIFNFLFNLVEYISKPLSHSLRLYGNMYAGEIIFLLLGLWAATGVAGTVFGAIFSVGWAIFHILIVALQAFIFMMLTIVYIAMAQEGH